MAEVYCKLIDCGTKKREKAVRHHDRRLCSQKWPTSDCYSFGVTACSLSVPFTAAKLRRCHVCCITLHYTTADMALHCTAADMALHCTAADIAASSQYVIVSTKHPPNNKPSKKASGVLSICLSARSDLQAAHGAHSADAGASTTLNACVQCARQHQRLLLVVTDQPVHLCLDSPDSLLDETFKFVLFASASAQFGLRNCCKQKQLECLNCQSL